MLLPSTVKTPSKHRHVAFTVTPSAPLYVKGGVGDGAGVLTVEREPTKAKQSYPGQTPKTRLAPSKFSR